MNSNEWVELEYLQRIYPSLSPEQMKRYDELMDRTENQYGHPFYVDLVCSCAMCREDDE